MPYASLKEVFPDAPFTGTTGSYLDRLNPDRSRIEPFKNNGMNDNEIENFRDFEDADYGKGSKGYGLPQYANPNKYPYLRTSLNRAKYIPPREYNRGTIVKKSLPEKSPILHSRHLPGKMGGGYRIIDEQIPSGVLETKNYHSLDNAFEPTDFTQDRRLGTPLRRYMLEEKLPQEYKVMPREDYYSYITPAMEEQIVAETDHISCHNFYKHLKDCPECKRKVAGFFDQSSRKIPFREKMDMVESFADFEGYVPPDFSQVSVKDPARKGKTKMNKMAELLLVILMGIFIIFIMNIFLRMKA